MDESPAVPKTVASACSIASRPAPPEWRIVPSMSKRTRCCIMENVGGSRTGEKQSADDRSGAGNLPHSWRFAECCPAGENRDDGLEVAVHGSSRRSQDADSHVIKEIRNSNRYHAAVCHAPPGRGRCMSRSDAGNGEWSSERQRQHSASHCERAKLHRVDTVCERLQSD